MDNTVGRLTKTQHSVLVGTLLGDGYVRIITGRRNAFLEVNHSFKGKDYVDWKYQQLSNIVLSPPKIRKGKNRRLAYRFFTRQHEDITKLFASFYLNGKKIVPKTNFKLDALSIAVWYMDDGSKCGNNDYYLNTQQFDIESQQRLINMLNSFNVESRINKDKNYWRIRLVLSSVERFKDIVSPYIIPSMKYKL